MLAEVHQPALSKAIHESLGKAILENMPPITENLEIDGVLCISLSKKNDKQIVVKIHDTIEPRNIGLNEPSSGRSSPWQIPLEKIQAAQQRFLSFNGPEEDAPSPDALDLRGPRLSPTGEEPLSAFKHSNGARASPLGNSISDSGSESGKAFEGSMAIPPSGNIPIAPKPMPDVEKMVSQAAESRKAPYEMQCKICPQVCVGGLPALQAHTQEAHKRFVCRFCYNTFSLRCNLKRHERLHVGAKPYSCKLCSKAFTRSTDLKIHMHKHGLSGDDVVVPCPQCPRTFLSVQNLRWHLYKVHKETEATFACTICEKLFMDKDEYMKHREDHTNNLIQNRPPSSCTTSESHDNDMDVDFHSSDGSDSEQLMIDTQSEGTMDHEDISLPNLNNADESSCGTEEISLELVNGPNTKVTDNSAFKSPVSQTDINNRPNETATPTPSQSSTGSTSGSRKRKIQKPTRVIEIVEENDEDYDIDNMYYNSPAAKAKRAEKTSSNTNNVIIQGGDMSLLLQDEPENLVTRPRVSTPGPTGQIGKATSHIMASSTLCHIAQSLSQNTIFPKPVNSVKNNTGFSQVVLGNILSPTYQIGQPRLATVTQTFPNATPILITPERYNPQPDVKKSGGKSRSGNIPNSVSHVNKSKIENVEEPAIEENKEYQCGEMGCNETYLGFSAYEDHCMIRHGRYPCKYCKQTFSGKNNRTRHTRCHLGAKTYTCPDCNKNFSRPDSMREHQFIHTLSYQEDKCRNCGSAFDKKNLLLAHLKQCYRHKMETGKSTKFIDETPLYLNNPQHANKTNATKTDTDALAPLKPIKLESIPAFKHIDPSLDNANALSPSSQIPIVASVYSMAEPRGSPTVALNSLPVLLGSHKSVSSPLNLSGGSLTTPTASPLTIHGGHAFPSPLVIVPSSASPSPHVPAGLVAAASIASSANRSTTASPLLIAPSPPAPLVIEPVTKLPKHMLMANNQAANSILASSLLGKFANDSADVTPSVSPKSTPSRADSPSEQSEPVNGTKVMDAVKKLVDKRSADENKDQNANTKTKEVGAGGDE